MDTPAVNSTDESTEENDRKETSQDSKSDPVEGEGLNSNVLKLNQSEPVLNGNDSHLAEDFQGAGDSNVEYMKLKSEANVLAKSGQLEAALRKYQEAMEKAKTDLEFSILKHNKGIVYEALKKFTVALEHYEAALGLNPNYYKAMKRKCKMLNQLEIYEDARKAMKSVFLMERKDNMGRQEDTQELWKHIVRGVGINKAVCLMKEDKPVVPTDAEVESVLRAFYCDPVSILWKKKPWVGSLSSNIKSGYAAAVDALHRKKYDQIIPHCDAELANPSSECKDDAHMLRGTFRFLWGYEKTAIADFTAVLSSENIRLSHKTKSSAAVKCALCFYHRFADEEQTLLFISIARDHWEMNSDAYYLLAMMRKDGRKDYDGAAQFLQIAVEYCPVTEPDNLYNTEFLEVLYLKSNHQRHKDMLEDMEILEKKFDVPDCYYNYYKMLMEEGKPNEASVMIDKAIAMDPKNANYLVAKIMDQNFERTRVNINSKLVALRQIEKICGGKHHLVSYHIGCLELFLGNKDIGWRTFIESIDNCRSVFLVAERIVRKLDWEMKEELDEILKEKTLNYSISPELFDRSRMYDMKWVSPLCNQCGRVVQIVEEDSEETDEDDE